MLRRGSLIVVLTLSIAGCKGNGTNALTGTTQSRAPSADAVVVFVTSSWATEAGQPRELFSANVDGSKIEQLTACATAATPCDMVQVAFSTDRKRVAAVRGVAGSATGATALYFMDLSRSVEKLLFPRRTVSAVDWSPDNGFLVYAATGDGLAVSEELFYCLPDGTSDQVLTGTDGIRERSPRIDPTAVTAIFEQIDSTGVGRVAIYSSGGPVMVTSGPATGPALPGTPYVVGGDADPVFSPDSKRVAFRRLTSTGNGGLGTWDVMTATTTGSDLQTVATGAVFRGAPDWSSSGLVFVETDAAAGVSRLVVVQPDGSGRKVLREEPAAYQMGSPRWIPPVR